MAFHQVPSVDPLEVPQAFPRVPFVVADGRQEEVVDVVPEVLGVLQVLQVLEVYSPQ